eukprot:gene13410-15794_t
MSSTTDTTTDTTTTTATTTTTTATTTTATTAAAAATTTKKAAFQDDSRIRKDEYLTPAQKKEKLELGLRLHQCVRKGLMRDVVKCVQDGASVDYIACGFSTLGYAAFYGHNDIIRWLVEIGGADVNIEAQTTPLGVAINRNLVTSVQLLLHYEANPAYKELSTGKQLFSAAIANKNLEIVTSLFNTGKIDEEYVDDDDNGWLHEAAAISSREIVEYLVSVGILIAGQNRQGKTPLHRAVLAKNMPVIEYLLTHAILLDVQDMNGNTALHYAVLVASMDIVKMLVEAGARMDIFEYVNMRRPSKVAEAKGSQSISIYLKEREPPIPPAVGKEEADPEEIILPESIPKRRGGRKAKEKSDDEGVVDLVKAEKKKTAPRKPRVKAKKDKDEDDEDEDEEEEEEEEVEVEVEEEVEEEEIGEDGEKKMVIKKVLVKKTTKKKKTPVKKTPARKKAPAKKKKVNEDGVEEEEKEEEEGGDEEQGEVKKKPKKVKKTPAKKKAPAETKDYNAASGIIDWPETKKINSRSMAADDDGPPSGSPVDMDESLEIVQSLLSPDGKKKRGRPPKPTKHTAKKPGAKPATPKEISRASSQQLGSEDDSSEAEVFMSKFRLPSTEEETVVDPQHQQVTEEPLSPSPPPTPPLEELLRDHPPPSTTTTTTTTTTTLTTTIQDIDDLSDSDSDTNIETEFISDKTKKKRKKEASKNKKKKANKKSKK